METMELLPLPLPRRDFAANESSSAPSLDMNEWIDRSASLSQGLGSMYRPRTAAHEATKLCKEDFSVSLLDVVEPTIKQAKGRKE